jgi:hypothetical protein
MEKVNNVAGVEVRVDEMYPLMRDQIISFIIDYFVNLP